MSDQDSQKEHWTIDKRVPLALIILFVAQTAAGIWFMSKLDSRVASLEDTRQATAPQSDRLTRVEVRLENVQTGIEDIKRLIRKEP